MLTTSDDVSREPRACPVCESHSFDVVFPLAPSPLGFALRSTQEAARALKKQPLDLALCSVCAHCFLPYVVPPSESYDQYYFESAESPGLSGEMEILAASLWRDFGCAQGSLVVDIGSGDGTWLNKFKSLGATVVGVDASGRHAARASSSGIHTIHAYFSEETAQEILAGFGVPGLVTANFVTANVSDLSSFFRALESLADVETKVAITTGYHPDQFQINMFDFVYHEHLSYFSVQDFINLADRFGFRVVSVRKNWLKGGSIQVVLDKQVSSGHCEGALRLARIETWRGIQELYWYASVWARVQEERSRTLNLLDAMNVKSILGYGMSHSTTTLTYEFALEDRLSCLTDDAKSRHGMFAPGTGLEILSWDQLPVDKFDLVVILAWQHDKLIRDQLRRRLWNRPVVQPLPRAQLVDANRA